MIFDQYEFQESTIKYNRKMIFDQNEFQESTRLGYGNEWTLNTTVKNHKSISMITENVHDYTLRIFSR